MAQLPHFVAAAAWCESGLVFVLIQSFYNPVRSDSIIEQEIRRALREFNEPLFNDVLRTLLGTNYLSPNPRRSPTQIERKIQIKFPVSGRS